MVEVTKLPDGVAEGANDLKSWGWERQGIHISPLKKKKKQIRKTRKANKKQSRAIRRASEKFLESYEWRRLRYDVLKEFGAACQCCGRTRKDGITIHVDHILPRKTHPQLALVKENLQVLCHECNHGKGNLDTTDWR